MQESGPMLFLYFAFPCAEYRLHCKKISQADFDHLTYLVQNKIRPEVIFLRKCFPKAVRDMERYAGKNGLRPWSRETVIRFWHYHHGHDDGTNCKVVVGPVVEIKNNVVYVSDGNGSNLPAINIYNLHVEIGDMVSMHKPVVVMVDKKSATAR